MIKILHCADVHLDAPFVCGDALKSELRKNELFATFSSMMNYVKLNGIDIVLISGDLFDGVNVTRDTAAMLRKEFSDNPQCRFVIAPGNHDPYTEDSVYRRIDFPSNVYVFNSGEVAVFSFEGLNVDVYGYAFQGPNLDHNPIKGVTPDHPERINLLVAHGEITSGERGTCPISTEDIANGGFDYVALGHIHAGTDVETAGKTKYAYAGCLEGRDFGECGYKGAILCEIEKQDEETKSRFKKLRFCKRHYEIEHINVTGAQNLADVLPAVKDRVAEKGYSTDTLLRVVLEGEVSPQLVISGNAFVSVEEGLFYLEVVNKTSPSYDTEKLKSDPTVRGAFYDGLRSMLESGDEDERELALLALKYGLSALGGNNVIDF